MARLQRQPEVTRIEECWDGTYILPKRGWRYYYRWVGPGCGNRPSSFVEDADLKRILGKSE